MLRCILRIDILFPGYKPFNIMSLKDMNMVEKRGIPIRIVDAFSDKPFAGNPAGVVLDASGLTEDEMQKIANELNISITAFLLKGRGNADFRIRFFTPGKEIAMCGHGTVATFYTWGNEQLRHHANEVVTIKQETSAGVVPVEIKMLNGHVDSVILTLPKPTFKHASISVDSIVEILGINENEILPSYPFEIVYDGLYFLIAAVRDRDTLLNMKPPFEKIRQLSKELQIDSVEVFTFDTTSPMYTVALRTFLPIVGIDEDPVCGTGNSALASYLVKNRIIGGKDKNVTYMGEQGHVLCRTGCAKVIIDRAGDEITRLRVSGKATEVLSGNLYI